MHQRFIRLSWITPVPENLTQIVTSSINPSQRIKQLGEELLESTEKWIKLSNELSRLLPYNFIPEKNNPIDQISLLEIQDWARQTEEMMNNLCKITQETLKTRRDEEPQNYKQLIDDLQRAEDLRKEEAEFLAKKEQLQLKFGSRFLDMDTNWEEITQVLQWTRQFKDTFGPLPIPDRAIGIVALGNADNISNVMLCMLCTKFLELKKDLGSRFEKGLTYHGRMQDAAEIEPIYSKISVLRERVDDLQVWVDFKSVKKAITRTD